MIRAGDRKCRPGEESSSRSMLGKHMMPAHRRRFVQADSGRGPPWLSTGSGHESKRNAQHSAGVRPPAVEVCVPLHPRNQSDLPAKTIRSSFIRDSDSVFTHAPESELLSVPKLQEVMGPEVGLAVRT